MKRLDTTEGLPSTVAVPAYDRNAAATGIVHLGIGAFHRAHQAVYTDDAMADSGGDWMIEGISLRHPDVADRLNPQNGFYTVLTRQEQGPAARVIGAIRRAHVAPENPESVLALLADPGVRVVSLTVTEKAYGFSGTERKLDRLHPAMAADLMNPLAPAGPVGYLVEGLARRREAGAAPFTPLCCDNIPANGAVLRGLAIALAAARDETLARWIETEVPFPATMVDRIVPAPTDATYDDVERYLGLRDEAAVETEPFRQWVIEDTFATGRPAWEAGGALFATDVAPYEKMKLRMLNGAHSLLAWLGFCSGHETVRGAMLDPGLAWLVRRHMSQAARGLASAPPGIDLETYADDLCARFRNPGIAYATHQIASDSSQKLPQRILEPAAEALSAGLPIETYAIAVAGFMRYATGRHDDGTCYDLRDPEGEGLLRAVRSAENDSDRLADALFAYKGLFPPELRQSTRFTDAVKKHLATMLAKGVGAAIDAFGRSGT